MSHGRKTPLHGYVRIIEGPYYRPARHKKRVLTTTQIGSLLGFGECKKVVVD